MPAIVRQGAFIEYIDVYEPYRVCGQDNPNRNNTTYKMMDFKNPNYHRHSASVVHFTNLAENCLASDLILDGKVVRENLLKHSIIFVIVPSSKKSQLSVGLASLVDALVKKYPENFSRYDLLERRVDVVSSHEGGERTIEKHSSSITVYNDASLFYRNIVLVDDVVTTGSTIAACEKILREAGYTRVYNFALVKTADQMV